MKRFLLLSAMLGLMGFGMSSAMSQPTQPDEIGSCRWYCDDGKNYRTLGECSAACGAPSSCDKVC